MGFLQIQYNSLLPRYAHHRYFSLLFLDSDPVDAYESDK